jgi:hypothetical protein
VHCRGQRGEQLVTGDWRAIQPVTVPCAGGRASARTPPFDAGSTEMAKVKPISSKQAAKLFSDSLRKNGISVKNPDISKGWDACKEFCAVPIERTAEGFIFHAGFNVAFPDGERVVDYTGYNVSFTRYWYEKGDVSDTAQLAECSFQLPGKTGLRKHEWVDVEVDASDSDQAVRLTKLLRFVAKVEAIRDLWKLLRAASPTGMESYAGPR